MVQNGTQPNDDSLGSISTTSLLLLDMMAEGMQRTLLQITNVSTGGQVISISFGADAVAGKGIVLYPGGSMSEAIDGAFIPTNLAVYVVSSASGGAVAFEERHT
jgi:hypothetical protein